MIWSFTDFNKDSKPDIAYMLSQTVWRRASRWLIRKQCAADASDDAGRRRREVRPRLPILMPMAVWTSRRGNGYYVISPDCVKTPAPAKCKGPGSGVLWTSSTQDTSSPRTGSSVFDFNSDGKPEAVYRDECWLRVYNGADG